MKRGVYITVMVGITEDGIESDVGIGPGYQSFISGEKQPDGISVETHRQASKVYDRVLDFAEQIKR